jgi:ABC-2 type transport system permease protein
MKAQLEVFLKYRFLLQDLILKDIRIKYRKSVLGILWSVLNPLLMMLVITAVFENIFRVRIENFPIYYLSGAVMFNFFSEATVSGMSSVLQAASLIKKVYIPKYIFPLEKALFAFVNFLFSLIAVVLIYLILGVPLHLSALLFFIPSLYLLIFAIGIALVLASWAVYFRDIIHLYGVVLTAWTYLTPIVYPYDALPVQMQRLMQFNPMFHYVSYFRQVTLYGQIPSLATNVICAAFALLSLVVGLLIFKKNQDRFILFI